MRLVRSAHEAVDPGGTRAIVAIMSSWTAWALGLALLAPLTACTGDDIVDRDATMGDAGPPTNAEIESLFVHSCAVGTTCHGGSRPGGRLDLTAARGLSLL